MIFCENDRLIIAKFIARCYNNFIMLLNHKKLKNDNTIIKIKVGEVDIEQDRSTKLLGMNIQDNLGWNEHFKDLVSSLKKRLFSIRRVKNQISMAHLLHR